VGNLVDFDVLGGRFCFDHLAGTDIPVFNAMQLGFTGVVDREPYLHTDEDARCLVSRFLQCWSTDTTSRCPTLDMEGLHQRAVFTDLAFIEDKSWGYMLGTGG
jgi:hypothetical protein